MIGDPSRVRLYDRIWRRALLVARRIYVPPLERIGRWVRGER